VWAFWSHGLLVCCLQESYGFVRSFVFDSSEVVSLIFHRRLMVFSALELFLFAVLNHIA
jgi:hypothetical protein